MNAEALIQDLTMRGVLLERRGDRLHFEAPVGVLTEKDRAALSEHRDAILDALPADPREAAVAASREQRSLWAHAVGELAEAAGYPLLAYSEGHAVAPGPIPWGRFAERAPVPALRSSLAALREYLAEVGTPTTTEGGF